MSSDTTLEAEGSKCPIIKEWMDIPVLVSRAAGGKMADLGSQGINRESLSANADILDPIIREYGTLA